MEPSSASSSHSSEAASDRSDQSTADAFENDNSFTSSSSTDLTFGGYSTSSGEGTSFAGTDYNQFRATSDDVEQSSIFEVPDGSPSSSGPLSNPSQASELVDSSSDHAKSSDSGDGIASDDGEISSIDPRFVVHHLIQRVIKEDCCCPLDCGRFDRGVVRSWRCWHELRGLLSSLHSTANDKDVESVLPILILESHGNMQGMDDYYECSVERCKVCPPMVRLADVISLLHHLSRDLLLLSMACRSQMEEIDAISYSELPILATRHVALLQPCGPGDPHNSYTTCLHGVFEKLGERESPREALEKLNGQFLTSPKGKVRNDSPIQVQMNEDWMTDRIGVEGMKPDEERIRLFEIAKSPVSEEERVVALDSLRSHLFVCWDIMLWDDDTLSLFCQDLISTVQSEPNDKIREKIIMVIAEVYRNRMDPKSGEQEWLGVTQFLKESIESGDSHLKLISISIICHCTALTNFDPQWKPGVNSCLEDADPVVRSAASSVYLVKILTGKCVDPMRVSIFLGLRNLFILLVGDWVKALATFGETMVDVFSRHLVAVPNWMDMIIDWSGESEKYRMAPFIAHCALSDKHSLKRMAIQIMTVKPSLLENDTSDVVKDIFEGLLKSTPLLSLALEAFSTVIKKFFKTEDDFTTLVPLFLTAIVRRREMQDLPAFNASDDDLCCEGEDILRNTFNTEDAPKLLRLCGEFIKDEEPTKIMAALLALESIHTKNIMEGEIIGMITPFLNHYDPRIVYSAIHVILWTNVSYLKNHQEKVIPVLVSILSTASIHRLAACAAATIENIIGPMTIRRLRDGKLEDEEVEETDSIYTDGILLAVEGRLVTYRILMDEKKPNILSQFVSLISTLIKAAPNRMKEKYDVIIPHLMNIFRDAKDQILHEKTLECIARMGRSIGDEKISEIAPDIMRVILLNFTHFLPYKHFKNTNFLGEMKKIIIHLGKSGRMVEFLPDLISNLCGSIEQIDKFDRCNCCRSAVADLTVQLLMHTADVAGVAMTPFVGQLADIVLRQKDACCRFFPSLIEFAKISGGAPSMRVLWSAFWSQMRVILQKQRGKTSYYIDTIAEAIEEMEGEDVMSDEEKKEIVMMIGSILEKCDEQMRKRVESVREAREYRRREREEDSGEDGSSLSINSSSSPTLSTISSSSRAESRYELNHEEIEILHSCVRVINRGLEVLGTAFSSSLGPLLPLLFSLMDRISEIWRRESFRDSLIDNLSVFAPELGISIYSTPMADKSAFVPDDSYDDVSMDDDIIFGKMPVDGSVQE